MTPTVHRLPDPDALAAAAAAHIAERSARAIASRGRCRFGLAGGSTPRPVYEWLAGPAGAGRIDWARVELFWGDERCVPPDHDDSNYRMAEETLLRHVPVRSERVFRIPGELPAAEAARTYARLLGTEPLDIVLLGMGEDGHTASLFPGRPELEATAARVVPALAPTPPRERVTLTLRALGEARDVVFLVTGAGKAARVAQVFAEIAAGTPRLPAARVQPVHSELHWYLDDDAAGHLPPAVAANGAAHDRPPHRLG